MKFGYDETGTTHVDLTTSFINRFVSCMRQQGCPPHIYWNANQYFNKLLPDQVKQLQKNVARKTEESKAPEEDAVVLPSPLPETVREAIAALFQKEGQTFQAHASSLVATLEQLDVTPLPLLLANDARFFSYARRGSKDLGKLSIKKTIAFYTQRSAVLEDFLSPQKNQEEKEVGESLDAEEDNKEQRNDEIIEVESRKVLLAYIGNFSSNCDFLHMAMKHKSFTQERLRELLACVLPIEFKQYLQFVLNDIVNKPIGSAHVEYIRPLMLQHAALKNQVANQNAKIARLEELVEQLIQGDKSTSNSSGMQ